MSIQIYQPPSPLSRFVECFWYTDLTISYEREKILPTGTVELIINFGAPFRIFDGDVTQNFKLNTKSWLVGLQTQYILHEPIANTHMIGVRFKPGGTFPFFSFSASDIHDASVPLDAIWGTFADRLRDQLAEMDSIAEKFKRLENLLLQQMTVDLYHFSPIEYGIQEIVRSGGAISIKDLSHEVNMSQKHLANQFRRMVGVSPKVLARIFRFQQVLNSINPQQTLDWVQIAHQCNYYDQSHFNRDFAAFTGLTPTDYLALRAATFGNELEQGEEVHFVPLG